jgi:hypothetical protein
MSPLSRLDRLLVGWQQLAAKADGFFADVQRSHGSAMHCAPGCSQCCTVELTVSLVEGLALWRGLLGQPPAEREMLSRRAAGPAGSCALLVDHRCALYAWRPSICRTHGLAVAQRVGEVSCCPLNFVDEIPSGAVLDGALLGATLAVVDELAGRELGLETTRRIAVRDLVREGLDALPDGVRRHLGPAAML